MQSFVNCPSLFHDIERRHQDMLEIGWDSKFYVMEMKEVKLGTRLKLLKIEEDLVIGCKKTENLNAIATLRAERNLNSLFKKIA